MDLDTNNNDTERKKIALNFIFESGFITYKILQKFLKHNYMEIEYDNSLQDMFVKINITGKEAILEGIHWQDEKAYAPLDL